MKVLVTGAAGFIGSHLCEALVEARHEVIGIDNFDTFYSREIKMSNLAALMDNSLFTLKEGDIRKIDEYGIDGCDVVVHLAAKAGVLPSLKSPQEYVSVNVNGTQSILEWMRAKGVKKYVFASSSSIYGNNKKIPFKETDNVDHPISVYAATKKSCELLNHTYHQLFGIDTVNLRFFTVYGPRQRPDLAINKFMTSIQNQQPITMYGDGSSARDYTYVSDTISGILGAVDWVLKKDGVFETFNLGNHSPVALKDLIQGIEESIGTKAKIVQMEMQPGDVDITYADIEKASKYLNYVPQVSIHEGLGRYVKWLAG